MNGKFRHKGSVLLITIFVIALLAAVVMGMLQLSTEEIKLVHNQISAAQALAVAEAGLNDAFSELRVDSSWNSGFTDKAFNGSQGFVARVGSEVTVSSSSPYIIRIDNLRINE